MRLLSGLLLGIVAGMRSFSGPAAAAIAARRNHDQFARRFSGNLPAILQALAIAELVADKLPFVPDRRKPPAFAWRMISGAVSAAAVTGEDDSLALAALVGGAGAVAGTFGGAALRSRLAEVFGHDLPAALVEDVAAIAIALLAERSLRAAEPRLLAAA